jgi:hypothetical protein
MTVKILLILAIVIAAILIAKKGLAMGTVTVNGKTYVGNNIQIRNGEVRIDGKLQGDKVSGVVELKVTGEIGSLDTDASVNMNGTIRGNVSAGGSVNADNIGGSVSAGGSVNCDDVGGRVSAGGSVICDSHR